MYTFYKMHGIYLAQNTPPTSMILVNVEKRQHLWVPVQITRQLDLEIYHFVSSTPLILNAQTLSWTVSRQ